MVAQKNKTKNLLDEIVVGGKLARVDGTKMK